MAKIRSNDIDFTSSQFQRISQQQCEKLHNGTLEILERTGVLLYDQEAIDLLKSAGAFISEGNRVRIPSTLVETAEKLTVPIWSIFWAKDQLVPEPLILKRLSLTIK